MRWVLPVFLLMSAPGCGLRSEPIRAVVSAPRTPGEGGRPVLWVTPRQRTAQGELTPDEEAVHKTIVAEAGATPESVRALREWLDDDRIFAQRAAVERLALSPLPDARHGLLVASRATHPLVAARAREALLALPPADRAPLFRRALEQADQEVATAAAALWPLLLRGLPSRDAELTEVWDRFGASIQVALLQDHCADGLPSALIAKAWVSDDVVVKAAVAPCADPAATDDALLDAVKAALSARESAAQEVGALAAALLVGRVAPKRVDTALGAELEARVTDAEASPATRVSATLALAEVGRSDALGTLAVFVADRRPAMHVRGLQALERLARRVPTLAHPTLAASILMRLDDADSGVRQLAVTVAGALADARLVGTLVRRLSDGAVEVRRAAALALGRSGAKSAVGALVEIGLSEDDSATRDASAASLEHLVHGHPLPPTAAITDWLERTAKSDEVGQEFFGRDVTRWRRWYQAER